MKNLIKRIIEIALVLICTIAFVFLVAEADNAFTQICCTLGASATMVVCIKIAEKMGLIEEEDK